MGITLYSQRITFKLTYPFHDSPSTVNGELLEAITEKEPTDFKLRLRPLSSLTDEEKYECFRLAFDMVATSYTPHGITEDEEGKTQIYAYMTIGRLDLSLWSDGKMAATGWADQFKQMYSPIWNAPAVIAYLQSIGVYIPDSIDEKYVQLIEP